MKKTIIYIPLFLAALAFTSISVAQPHPNDTPTGTVSGDRISDAPAAPVGNGTLILFTLALAYAALRILPIHSTEHKE